MKIQRYSAILLILLGAASYGLLSPYIKLAYDDGWTEGQITASQMTMGTLVLWLLVGLQPKSWSNPFKGPWIKLILIGIFGLALTTVFYNVSLTELDASFSIVLLFQFTWITILIDSVVEKRWPSRFQFIAIGLVMLGTVLAVNLFGINLALFSVRGLFFGLASAISYSLFIYMTGRIDTQLSSLLKSAIMLTGAIPVIYLLYPPIAFFAVNGINLLIWGLLLGLLGQVIPTLFFNIGIPKVGGSMAAMLGSVELPVAVLGALVILGEQVLLVQWVGMGLILVGIMISERKPIRQ